VDRDYLHLQDTLHSERMIIMADDLEKKNARIKLVKKIGLIVTGLFVFCFIVGFYVVRETYTILVAALYETIKPLAATQRKIFETNDEHT